MTLQTTRGASFLPGQPLPKRNKETGKVVVCKPFDVKAWHKRKAEEARKGAKELRQIESCYRQHVPPQVKELVR